MPKTLQCTCAKESFLKNGCTCGTYDKWPGDKKALEAWNKIAQLARDNALIVQAGGGTMIIALPDNQREADIFLKCLYMSGFGPHPSGWEEKEVYLAKTK